MIALDYRMWLYMKSMEHIEHDRNIESDETSMCYVEKKRPSVHITDAEASDDFNI